MAAEKPPSPPIPSDAQFRRCRRKAMQSRSYATYRDDDVIVGFALLVWIGRARYAANVAQKGLKKYTRRHDPGVKRPIPGRQPFGSLGAKTILDSSS
ncbi:hypothetical protein BDZ45DRAFT_735882 [Acephala macrosclerotiorum]|nr:hypothetical protein BDZ45DRAFT_735882 [Acephala macrosclerotiorum]